MCEEGDKGKKKFFKRSWGVGNNIFKQVEKYRLVQKGLYS